VKIFQHLRDDFVAVPLALFSAIAAALLVYILAVNFLDQCPLEAGDRVVNGTVVMRENTATWTSDCTVGVKLADGTHSYVKAWQLEKVD
jgi:hypothetical protein